MTKYHARRTFVDGIWFASAREAKRYAELKLLERAGKIRDLALQPIFRLHAAGGAYVASYRADFTYKTDTETVVEDAKGFRTPLYKLKRKWLKLEHGIDVREI